VLDKFSIDYGILDKQRHFKYEDVKDRLVKVAYDVVRFKDPTEDIDGLWQVQATDDGEIIVAMYDDSDKQNSITKDSSWKAVADNRNESIYVFYNDEPIKRIASSEINIPSVEYKELCKDISIRLNNDSNFRSTLLNELPINVRAQLFTKFPELKAL